MSDPIPAEFLWHLADCADAETLPRFRCGTAVTEKGGRIFDPVTEADRQSERAIRAAIEARYPDHGIFGEEEGLTPGSAPWRWVIDPVDGTRAFICGAPSWCTLIGLEHEGHLYGGMIDQPFTAERWWAAPDGRSGYTRQGATTPLCNSGVRDLSMARLMITDMRAGEYLSDAEARACADLARSCRVTRQGLDAYGYGLLALGEIDLVVEAGLHWYDIAAVVPVVEAAGGVVVGWTGEEITEGFVRGRCLAAATRELAEAAIERLRHVPA